MLDVHAPGEDRDGQQQHYPELASKDVWIVPGMSGMPTVRAMRVVGAIDPAHRLTRMPGVVISAVP